MIVALAQNAPHPPAWLGLASVLFILLSCIILLLLPNSVWEAMGRVLRGETGLGAPFELDDGELAEAVGLTIEPWEPETGAFSGGVAEAEVEPEPEAEPAVAATWEPEIVAPAQAEPRFIEVRGIAPEVETPEIETPGAEALMDEAAAAEEIRADALEIPAGETHQPEAVAPWADGATALMEAEMPQADAPLMSAPEVVQSAFFRPRMTQAAPVAPIAAAPTAPGDEPADLLDRRCRMDLAATKDGLELVVELPGLEEKDVDIQVSDDVLTISGELKFEPGWTDKTYRLMERDYGAFSRSIELPEGVRPDRIRAAMHRGLLTVTIPNPTRPEPRRIEIEAPIQQMRLVETSEGVEVSLDLPGFEERDVEVAVAEGVLTVRGERQVSGEAEAEAGPPAFSRTIELPEGANPDFISAALAKGVLTVRIPNPVRPDARRIPVQAAA